MAAAAERVAEALQDRKTTDVCLYHTIQLEHQLNNLSLLMEHCLSSGDFFWHGEVAIVVAEYMAFFIMKGFCIPMKGGHYLG